MPLALEPARELAGQRRLAGALQAGEHDHRRRLLGEPQPAGLAAEDVDQLLVDDLDDLLGGVERARDLRALGPLLDPVDEGAHHRQRDVRLQQRDADLARGGVDVGVGEAALAAQVAQGPAEPVGEGVEHALQPSRPQTESGSPVRPRRGQLPNRTRSLWAIRAIVVEIRIPIGTLRSSQRLPRRRVRRRAASPQLIVRVRKGRRRLETSGRSAVPIVRSPIGARPSSPERALSGAPAAIRLFREVTEFAADPELGRCAPSSAGPEESGKSVLLGLLADALRGAGVTVVDDAENAVDPDPGAVVLLDDVHDLDEPTLGALRRGLARPAVRVVVAHRPLSGRVGPAALLRAVEVGGATVVLGPLSRAGVADRAALLLGGHPDPALVGTCSSRPGGCPGSSTGCSRACATGTALPRIAPS